MTSRASGPSGTLKAPGVTRRPSLAAAGALACGALALWVARGLPTVEPNPLYLRRPDVAEPTARKSVL